MLTLQLRFARQGLTILKLASRDASRQLVGQLHLKRDVAEAIDHASSIARSARPAHTALRSVRRRRSGGPTCHDDAYLKAVRAVT
jgi:hypothetical protein